MFGVVRHLLNLKFYIKINNLLTGIIMNIKVSTVILSNGSQMLNYRSIKLTHSKCQRNRLLVGGLEPEGLSCLVGGLNRAAHQLHDRTGPLDQLGIRGKNAFFEVEVVFESYPNVATE